MVYTYKTKGTCSTKIELELEGNIVHNVKFTGGCNGNLKAISKVIDGMTVEQIEGYFIGNLCGRKNTSCADQLARVVRKAYEESKQAG